MRPMISTIIVDDEELARRALARELTTISGMEVIGEAASAADAIQLIESEAPQLVFLDIEMPEMTGIEMLAQLNVRPSVIFVTAYSQYATKAFDLNAVDYVLKPIRPERVHAAVMRASERIHFRPGAAL